MEALDPPPLYVHPMASKRTAFSASNCIKLLSLLCCALFAVLVDRLGPPQRWLSVVTTTTASRHGTPHEAPEIAVYSLTRAGAVVFGQFSVAPAAALEGWHLAAWELGSLSGVVGGYAPYRTVVVYGTPGLPEQLTAYPLGGALRACVGLST